jgi:hypothetical protein
MKLINIILLVQFISSISIAQSKDYKNHITFNPASFYSPYHRNIDLSIGRKINSDFLMEVGIATIIPGGNWSDGEVGREDGKGIILKLEPKFRFNKRIDNQGDLLNYFISLRTYRTFHNYTSSRYEDDSINSIVKYKVESRVWGFIPHVGFYSELGRLYTEPSIGYGIRKLSISNDFNGDISELSEIFRFNKRFEPEENGNYIRGSISLSLKLGIRF